jgi:DNA-binding beta-propeller fold protein YncE
VAVSPGGRAVFVTGTSFAGTSGGTSHEDYATVSYNAVTGARLWASRYHGPAGHSDAAALAVSPDGTKVFVTGATENGASRWDYATVAYKR